jgi:hypothetical protein
MTDFFGHPTLATIMSGHRYDVTGSPIGSGLQGGGISRSAQPNQKSQASRFSLVACLPVFVQGRYVGGLFAEEEPRVA